ncbi:hypothetical protein DENSPDRAFT_833047 [Dentipellis sp. KUC8613]|nr:hypothetical protein DENSPDRAFT_833047 [Dentipellis sp. KUC8613]
MGSSRPAKVVAGTQLRRTSREAAKQAQKRLRASAQTQRTVITLQQEQSLSLAFRTNPVLDGAVKRGLVEVTGLTESQVGAWFRSQRRKWKNIEPPSVADAELLLSLRGCLCPAP